MGDPGVDVLGLSVRLPQSTSATQFWQNLLDGRDMVTESRWPGLYGAPLRAGVVPDFDVFDAPFFSVHGKQNQVGFGQECSGIQ
jgi:fatty acid synthase